MKKLSLVLAAAFLVLSLVFLGCSTTKRTGNPSASSKQVGLQLYSLRAQFAKDVPGTLNKVRDFGIKYVESAGTYGMTPAKFKSELEARGIKAVAGHFPYDRYRDDADGIAHEAKELGLEYAGCAWISHNAPFDEKQCREAAAVFNRAGKILAEHGIKFFYHNHGYEFQPYKDGTLFDLLMKETDPKLVSYEMDVFWVVHPAQDPVKLLQKYGDRWKLMHVKDMAKGTPTGLLTGHADVESNVTVGTGIIDYPAVFRAAKKAGLKWYFIEDESSRSEQQIPQSYRYIVEGLR
jgi:sugar phosphate isomerase/epimerase